MGSQQRHRREVSATAKHWVYGVWPAEEGRSKKVPLVTAISGLAPKGGFDMTPFRRLINGVVKRGNWVDHPALWLVTVNTSTGERTAFGHPHAPKAAVNDAVCASYGVPGWCPPIKIGEHEYMDGGVASPTSADLLLDTDVDEVVILAPMTTSQPDNPIGLPARLERMFRRHMTRTLDPARRVQVLNTALNNINRPMNWI